ncbi:hypothetical protein AB7M50_001509 [Bradyrhizobium elkanii]
MRIGASVAGRQFDAAFERAARSLRLQLVAALQRPRVGAAEPGAGVDGEAAEHRLAFDAVLDREIAERAAAGKAKSERLTFGERRRAVERDRPAADIRIARRAGKGDAHRAAACGEAGAERADLHRGGEQVIADQRVGGRQRKPVHRSARHETVALRARTPAVLHRACRADRGDDELAHGVTSSATSSPASAARSCSAKVLASTAVKVMASPGSSRKVGSRCNW